MTTFSTAAWRLYCAERVSPPHAYDAAQLARIDRLLNMPGTQAAWRALANDVTTRWPEHLGELTWQLALHQVIGTIVCPPSMIAKTVESLKNGPFMPAHTAGKNAQRNWVALYVKTWVVPGFFNRRHYEEIALLVNVAWGTGDEFSADQVRLLRPYHHRRPRNSYGGGN